MKILLKIPEEILPRKEIPGEEDRSRLVEEAGAYINGLYTEALDCGDDTYLRDRDGEDFTFGFENPGYIRDEAQRWNGRCRRTLIEVMTPFLNRRSDFELDTLKTYALFKASAAADNRFIPFADYMAVVEDDCGNAAMKPLISATMALHAQACPERYCVVEIYPK